MNEEEIIKRLKNIIETNKSFLDCDIQENNNIYKDIQGLLDLYQQEKEKNKLLIDGKFREVADKNSYIKDNYISKDKIKELREIDNIDLIQFKIRELLEERN